MAAYHPPSQILPIFNPLDYVFTNFPLTINDAKNYFVEYPTAQGTETLLTTIVNGSSTFNDTATFNDLVEVKQPTPALNGLNVENDTPGVSITATSITAPTTAGLLSQQGSAALNETNPIVEAGDSVISSSIFGADDTGGLVLTQKSTATPSGIRLNSNKIKVFPGIMFPDGTEQITAAVAPGSGNTSTVSIEYTGVSGSFINIPIPAGVIKADVQVFAMGGIAGSAYVGGSYYVMGGSGGGGGAVACYGVPVEGSQMDFYWTSGQGNEAHIQITQNPATSPPPAQYTFNLGAAYNGSNGGTGQSTGTGAAGVGGIFTPNTSYVNGGSNGLNGQLGTSNAVPFGAPPPNTAAPSDVGRIKNQFRWAQEGLLGVGQKWLANSSLGTSNTAYGGLPTVVITWFLP